MEIILNNNRETIEDNVTISEILKIKNFTFKFLVVRVNGVLIKKDKWDETTVKEGDVVNIIHLISGG
jgi:thiamine biosynthesis protein ThiS